MKDLKGYNLDNLINLYFFDPKKDRNKYINFYKRSIKDRYKKEKGYRYSNIYLLRKDIKFCLGLNKSFSDCPKEIKNEITYFGAIILINTAIDLIVSKIFNGNYIRFTKKYLKIENDEYAKALRYLRNGLVHNYSLYCYAENNNKYFKKGEKVYFNLDFYNELISKNLKWKRKYSSSMYNINPRILYSRFVNAIEFYKKELLDRKNNKLRLEFKDGVDIDNWILLV